MGYMACQNEFVGLSCKNKRKGLSDRRCYKNSSRKRCRKEVKIPERREIISNFHLLNFCQSWRGDKCSFGPLEGEYFCPWEEVGKTLLILARSESLCGRGWWWAWATLPQFTDSLRYKFLSCLLGAWSQVIERSILHRKRENLCI